MEKKGMVMEDYLRKKGRLPEKDLGKIYCFQASPKGVDEIKELLIWKTHKTKGWRGSPTNEVLLNNYEMKEAPYYAEIWGDEVVHENRATGSGFGDLWGYTWFSSMDRDALLKERVLEQARLVEYIKKQPKTFYGIAMQLTDDERYMICLLQEGTGNTKETSKLTEYLFPYGPMKGTVIINPINDENYVTPQQYFQITITETPGRIEYEFNQVDETPELIALFVPPDYFSDLDTDFLKGD